MSTTTFFENVSFESLNRPGTAKGAILASDGTNFVTVGPGGDGEVLISDAAEPAGLRFGTAPSSSVNVSMSVPCIALPITVAVGGDAYSMRDRSNRDTGADVVAVSFPNATLVGIGVSVPSTGFGTGSGTITGGQLEFLLGRLPAGGSTTIANWSAYPTSGPDPWHFAIDGADILANNNASFIDTSLNVAITDADKVCVRVRNNITSGGGFTPGSIFIMMYFVANL